MPVAQEYLKARKPRFLIGERLIKDLQYLFIFDGLFLLSDVPLLGVHFVEFSEK